MIRKLHQEEQGSSENEPDAVSTASSPLAALKSVRGESLERKRFTAG